MTSKNRKRCPSSQTPITASVPSSSDPHHHYSAQCPTCERVFLLPGFNLPVHYVCKHLDVSFPTQARRAFFCNDCQTELAEGEPQEPVVGPHLLSCAGGQPGWACDCKPVFSTDFWPGQAVWTGDEPLSTELQFRQGEVVERYAFGTAPQYLVRWLDGDQVYLHEKFLLPEPPVRCGDLDCANRAAKTPGCYWVAGWARCQTCLDDIARGREAQGCRCQAEYVPMRSGHLHGHCTPGFCPCKPAAAPPTVRGCAMPIKAGLSFASSWQESSDGFCPEPAQDGDDYCARHSTPEEPVAEFVAEPVDALTARKLAAALDWHRVFTARGDTVAAQGELEAAYRYAAEILADEAPAAAPEPVVEASLADVQANVERAATRTVISFAPMHPKFQNIETGRILTSGWLKFDCGHAYHWTPRGLADDESEPQAGGRALCAICLSDVLSEAQA